MPSSLTEDEANIVDHQREDCLSPDAAAPHLQRAPPRADRSSDRLSVPRIHLGNRLYLFIRAFAKSSSFTVHVLRRGTDCLPWRMAERIDGWMDGQEEEEDDASPLDASAGQWHVDK